MFHVLFFKHKTAYEIRISYWSSDVCSSDLFRGQFLEVVDLAVVDDRDSAILVVHRLLAAGEVDDRKAAVTQPDAAVDEKAATVRPAVREAVGHRLEQVPVDRPPV